MMTAVAPSPTVRRLGVTAFIAFWPGHKTRGLDRATAMAQPLIDRFGPPDGRVIRQGKLKRTSALAWNLCLFWHAEPREASDPTYLSYTLADEMCAIMDATYPRRTTYTVGVGEEVA